MMNQMGISKETLQLLVGRVNSAVLDSIYIFPRKSELEKKYRKIEWFYFDSN